MPLRPAWRGHGYAREALTAVLAFCLHDLAVSSVWGQCDAGNQRSAAVMRATGMTPIEPSADGDLRFRAGPAWRLPGQRRSNAALLAAVLYERSPAVDGDDDVAFAEDLHGVADGDVGNSVLFGEVSFGGQFPGDFASADPALYVVRDLDVGVLGPVGVNLSRWHETMVDLL